MSKGEMKMIQAIDNVGICVTDMARSARMECGTELAATVFGPSYKRAARMQVILALTATIAGALVWLMNGDVMWLIGALCIFAVVPFTLIVITPINKKLLDPALDRSSAVARDLL